MRLFQNQTIKRVANTTPIHEPYKALYQNKDKFVILVTGGRGSGKSFEVSRFIERLTFMLGHTILYSRYTMTSATKSVIPAVRDKIDRDGTGKYFHITSDTITNKLTGSNIIFTGIRTSSGQESAKLKSIERLSVFVCDEAEEWASGSDYEKLLLSVRQKGVQNMVIVIMNPSNTNHFIYTKYIKDTHKIEYFDGVPVQISTHPNVLHIHTSYLDNLPYLEDNFIREVEEMKINDPDKYAHIVMGRWIDSAEGAVFKNYEIVEQIPFDVEKKAIGLDFGYSNDPSAAVLCAMKGDCLYMDELFYSTAMLSRDYIQILKNYRMPVIADSADPRLIEEIKRGSVNIHAVEKGAGSVLAGIQKMQELKLCVTKRSENLIYELQNYVWDKSRIGEYINKPIDANNHAIDAVRYYVLDRVLGRSKKNKRRDYRGIFP